MGRNNHLQIKILKHDFCGEPETVFTHARYWQIKKYVCMIFLWGGGGTENLWGGLWNNLDLRNFNIH